MNSQCEFENVRVIVFGGLPGARYRAGRTCRILKKHFKHVTDGTTFDAYSFSKLLQADDRPIWLVRAGTLPRHLSQWHLPHPSPNGKALCGFGLASFLRPSKTLRANSLINEALNRECASLASECADWMRLQSQSGGDFSSLYGFDEKCPRALSVQLNGALVAELSRRVAEGLAFDTALRMTLTAIPHRCVRLSHLDVFDDPALRVAQVSTSLQRGGAERVTLDLTRELPRCGVRPLFFALGSPTRSAFEKPEEFVDFPSGRNRTEHVRQFAERAVALGCDAVHAHLLSAGDMAIVAKTGLPVVATVHNLKQGWPAGMSSPDERLPIALLAACSRAVERDVVAAKFDVPMRTVWNGIDTGSFAPSPETECRAHELRSKLELADDDFVLLSLANPRPQKRLERLPAVLAALQSELKKRGISRRAKLIVAGEASRSSDEARRSVAALLSEIERLNLTDSIHLIGPFEDVAPLLRACDTLVSVSEWEGLSLAHLEALAAGRPVVATDAGGTAEIASENSALTIVPLAASPESIAAKLADIAEKKSTACNERKRSSFTLHCMAERYASLYPRAIEFTRGTRRGEGIWLIANNFTTGGAQSSARRLLLGMKSKNIAARAAVLQEREDHPTPGLSALRSAGVPVFIPEPRSADPLDAVLQILERIDADPPRAILFWNAIAEHKILLADSIFDIPIYDVSPGEMFFNSLDAYFARPRPGLPYRCAADYGARLSGIVVKFRRESERAESSLKLKPHVIPNGLVVVPNSDSAHVDRAESEFGSPMETRFVIGTSARISPQKKLEELIESLRLAAPQLPPYVLKIAGRPEAGGDAYAQSLKDLGAGLNIEWIGEFQDSKSFLANLNLFAMISEPAGCPNASLEAMAAGLAVVATDHGGASEQVEDGVTGRLVQRGDVEAFAAALVELAHDSQRRSAMGLAGRTRAGTCFSVERMVGDYRKLCGV